MNNKQSIFSGLTTTVLVVAIIVVANIVSMNLFTRADLTEGKIYSLNEASKRIVGDLEDDFLIKAYFSKDLPPPYNQTARYLQDQLDEYKAYGKGRFRYQFVDPGDDEELEKEAQQHRIPPVQVQVVKEDQFQAQKAYLGLVLLYQDRQETIPVIDNPAGLEYEITSSIKKLISEEKDLPKIGFLVGHQEATLAELQTVQQVFAKQYRLVEVDVSAGKRVDDDVQALIIASPRSPISDWEKYAIDQYIMKGGRVAFLVEKVSADLQVQQATQVRLDADEWFSNYGFGVNDNLIADLVNAGALTVTQQQGFFQTMTQVRYPYIPNLRDFDRSNVMVKDLERISLYFASTVDTSAAESMGLKVEPLLMSSAKTQLQENVFTINPIPSQGLNEADFDAGQQVLAAIISGSFTSYFKDKAIPTWGDSAVAPILGDSTVTRSAETRIFVVGDGEFFVDRKGGADRDNLLFFQNMVDWMVQDEDLIAIRSRDVTDRPLKELTAPKRRLVKFASMLGSPALVIVCGILVWQFRRRRVVEI